MKPQAVKLSDDQLTRFRSGGWVTIGPNLRIRSTPYQRQPKGKRRDVSAMVDECFPLLKRRSSTTTVV
jgi:hypothetical protein